MKTLPNGSTLKSIGLKAEANGRFHYAVRVERHAPSGRPLRSLHHIFSYDHFHVVFKELGIINPTGFDENSMSVLFMFEAEAALFHLYLA